MPNTDNVIHKGTAEILVNNRKLCFSSSFGRLTNYIVWIIHVIIITFNYKSDQNVNWDKGFCTIRNSYMYLFHLVKSLLSIMQTTRSWKKYLLRHSSPSITMPKHETEPVSEFFVLIGLIVFTKNAVIYHISTLDRPKLT